MNTRRRRSHKRAVRLVSLAVILVASVTAFFVVLAHPEAAHELPAWMRAAAAEPTVAANADREAGPQLAGAVETTPVYRHSVVPGGVRSALEVDRAIRLDPVVRAHYRGLDVANLRVVTVTEPQTAYVSYRVGDQIHWTGQEVSLEPGEQLLTDGTIEIRARCGNLVSDAPVETPLADSTPVESLDEIEPAAAPLLAAVNERIGTPAFLAAPSSQALAQAGPSIGSAGALGAIVPPVLLAGGLARGSTSDGPGHDMEIPTGACRPVGF